MDLYNQILATPLPTVIRTDLRRESRKERAKAVRGLFKALGLKGISVTAPNYSMAQSIDISLPHDRCENPIHLQPTSSYRDCAACDLRRRAQSCIEPIILAAFPDLDNRSDSQSDHFDYCLSVR